MRNTNDSDFADHLGDYMVWIAQKRLTIQPAPYPEKALYEWVKPDTSAICLCGYGMVAKSVEWLKDKYALVMNSREQVKSREKS